MTKSKSFQSLIDDIAAQIQWDDYTATDEEIEQAAISVAKMLRKTFPHSNNRERFMQWMLGGVEVRSTFTTMADARPLVTRARPEIAESELQQSQRASHTKRFMTGSTSLLKAKGAEAQKSESQTLAQGYTERRLTS